MRGARRAKLFRWVLVLATAGLFSAAVALATDSGTAGPSRPRISARHPSRCSRKEPRIPAEVWPAARHVLAPAGASEIRLCRYAGLNAHPPLALVRSRLLNRAGLVAQLMRMLDGLPSGPSGAVACPMDDGSEIVAVASYPDGPEVRISIGLTGCELVSNGSVHRTASGYGPHPKRGPRLLAELERLVGGRALRS